jgi:hypothetical protein
MKRPRGRRRLRGDAEGKRGEAARLREAARARSRMRMPSPAADQGMRVAGTHRPVVAAGAATCHRRTAPRRAAARKPAAARGPAARGPARPRWPRPEPCDQRGISGVRSAGCARMGAAGPPAGGAARSWPVDPAGQISGVGLGAAGPPAGGTAWSRARLTSRAEPGGRRVGSGRRTGRRPAPRRGERRVRCALTAASLRNGRWRQPHPGYRDFRQSTFRQLTFF